MLSWYNHAMTEPKVYITSNRDKYVSFDSYSRFMVSSGHASSSFTLGQYIKYIEAFKANSHAQRSQLLVLAFDEVVGNPKAAMKQLTVHYGLPVLSSMATLPEENSKDGPGETLEITCMRPRPRPRPRTRTRTGAHPLTSGACARVQARSSRSSARRATRCRRRTSRTTRPYTSRSTPTSRPAPRPRTRDSGGCSHAHAPSTHSPVPTDQPRPFVYYTAPQRPDPGVWAQRTGCTAHNCWVSPRVSAHMHRYEAPFAKFNLEESVKCGTHERTMGGLSTSELLAHFQ